MASIKGLERRARNTPRVAERKGALYWEPSKTLRAAGMGGCSLGPMSRAALDRADALNAEADACLSKRRTMRDRAPRPGERTFSRVVAAYKGSREFARLRETTQRHYRRHISILEEDFGELNVASITPRAIKNWYWPIYDQTPRDAHNIFRTLRLILSFAVAEEMLESNPAKAIRVDGAKPRSRIGTRDEIRAMCAAALRLGRPSIGIFAMAAAATMQRPADVRALHSGHVQGDEIVLTQAKTGKRVRIAIHPALAAMIAGRLAQPGINLPLVVSESTGAPYAEFAFIRRWAAVRAEAAKDCPSVIGSDPAVQDPTRQGALNAADMRRTGMVFAAQGGATLAQICSASGHTLDYGLKILETYVPREALLARQAVAAIDFDAEPGGEVVLRGAIDGW